MSSQINSTPSESNPTTSPSNQPFDPYSDEAPLLTLLQKPPHMMTREELEAEIANLRSIRVNSHVLAQAIQKETTRGRKGKKSGPSDDLISDLL